MKEPKGEFLPKNRTKKTPVFISVLLVIVVVVLIVCAVIVWVAPALEGK